jgi:cytochrome c-type biogenesis protein
VPGYISSVAGVTSTSEIKARRVIGPTLAFIGSFSAVYIALGLLGQQALRGALTGSTSQRVCGAIIVVMGLLFVLSPFVPRLSKQWHVPALMNRAGRSGPVLTGMAFAVAWTPCSGPTLGAIVTAAGTSSSALHGGFLLAIYCAGLGVPFLITGLAFGKATAALNVVKRHYPVVIGVGGFVLIGMGVLIFTGQFTELNIHVNNWLHAVGLPNLNGDT